MPEAERRTSPTVLGRILGVVFVLSALLFLATQKATDPNIIQLRQVALIVSIASLVIAAVMVRLRAKKDPGFAADYDASLARANEASARITQARKNSLLFVVLPLLVVALLALVILR